MAAKWIVKAYPRDGGEPEITEFETDESKNTAVTALRADLGRGVLTHIDVIEPATDGLARIT